MGGKETEEEKCDRGGNSNGINDNRTDQNNEDHTEQSNEDGTMSLQPDELPLNHKIVIEKCGISQLEDGLCHVCSKELGTGSAI